MADDSLENQLKLSVSKIVNGARPQMKMKVGKNALGSH